MGRNWPGKAVAAMNDYLIIADDFTGANDSGVHLKKAGIPVKVTFNTQVPGGGSVILDTETRNLSGSEAGQVMAQFCQQLDFAGFGQVIKKIDSTLRGNLVEEISVLAAAFEPETVVFLPAYPDQQRLTRQGTHFVKGQRILETEFAKDLFSPAKSDCLLTILEAIFPKTKISLLSQQDLTPPPSLEKGFQVFGVDAASNEDIREAVQYFLAHFQKILWIGSAGLIQELVGYLEPPNPSLAVIASISQETRSQLAYAKAQGMKILAIPFEDMLSSEKTAAYLSQGSEILLKNQDLLLVSGASVDPVEIEKTRQLADALNMDLAGINRCIQEYLGDLTRALLKNQKINTLFLSGGETAKGILDWLEAETFEILDEAAPGIPLLKIVDGPFKGLKLMTKAGGFGSEAAIYQALYLGEPDRSSRWDRCSASSKKSGRYQ